MNLFMLIFSTLFSNIIQNITNPPYINREHYSGKDDRVKMNYPFITDSENEILRRIRRYYYCMAIINYLQSSCVSENDKLDTIQYEIGENSHKIYDLYAGGLMDDWEMDF